LKYIDVYQRYTCDKQFHATNWQILIVFYFLETVFISYNQLLISCFRRRSSFCPRQNMFRFTENMMHVHTVRSQNFSTKPVAAKYPHLPMAKLFGCILKAKKIIFYRAN